MSKKTFARLKVKLIAALEAHHALSDTFDAVNAPDTPTTEAQQRELDAAADRCVRLCDRIIKTPPGGAYRGADQLVTLAAICLSDSARRLRSIYAAEAAEEFRLRPE